MLQDFLRQTLSAEQAEDLARHLNSCRECQSAAEAVLSLSAWSADLLWLDDQPAAHCQTKLNADDETPAPPLPGAAFAEEGRPPIRTLAGRFELRRTIGMGGCGSVYEAWDNQLRRDVAIKLPHWTLIESPAVQQRFAIEARAAARLSHPNIVPVFEAVVDASDNSFLVTELIRGPSLEDWLESQRTLCNGVRIRDAAAIVTEIAIGVDAAHRSNVLHRDLKPSNILLSPVPAGELPFTPRIADFGLARLSEEATLTTINGGVFGTLPYLAPELAQGSGPATPASDLYSLGVILYQLLTGRLPLTATTPAALLTAIASQAVVPPRRLSPEIPVDLEAICLKCLEKRSRDRYRTAAELAADLRRFLAGQPVLARLPGRFEQLCRLIRRNPAGSTVAATIVVATAVILGVLVESNRRQRALIDDLQQTDQGLKSANLELATSNDRLNAALRSAASHRRSAESQQRRTQEYLYVSEFQRAVKAWEEQDLPQLELLLDRLEKSEFQPYRGVELSWLRAKIERKDREITRFERPAYSLVFSDDGNHLAAAGRDDIIRIVRYADGVTVRQWNASQREVNDLVYVDGGRRLWSSGDDGSLVQWDVDSGRELLRLPAHGPGQAHNLLLIPAQNRLLSTGTDGHIRLWDPLSGSSLGVLAGNGATVVNIDLHKDGRDLYAAYTDRICCWDLKTETLRSTWEVGDAPTAMRLTGAGTCMACTSKSDWLDLRDVNSGKVLVNARIPAHIRQIIRTPRPNLLLAIDDQGVSHMILAPIWPKFARPQFRFRVIGRFDSGRGFATIFSPDGLEIVTARSDGSVVSRKATSIWNNPGEDLRLGPAAGISFPSDGESILFSDGQNLVRRHLDSQQQKVVFRVPVRGAHALSILPDGGQLLFETDPDGTGWLVHRSPDEFHVLDELKVSARLPVTDLYYIPRLQLAVLGATAEEQSAWRLFSINPLQELKPWRRNGPLLSPAAISIEQGFLIDSFEGAVAKYDLTDREERWRNSHHVEITAAAVSSDGTLVAYSTIDRLIRIVRADAGEVLHVLPGHRHRIRSLLFSHDGRTLFSGDMGESEISEVRCWRVSTGDMLAVMDQRRLATVHRLYQTPSTHRLLIHRHPERLQSILLKPIAD